MEESGNIGSSDSCSERAIRRAASGHSADASRRALSSMPAAYAEGSQAGRDAS